jgi:hypothetical protein
MLEVTRAEYRDGYKVWIEFSNGESGIVDLSDALWGPMFEPLKDIERFKRFVVSPTLHTLAWDIAHNFVAEEEHFGERLFVHRKGAIRLAEGQVGLIPGSMGTCSYVVAGRENPFAFNSCSHGAGRAMSRGDALPEKDEEESPRCKVADALRYLENQESRMHYDAYRRLGLPISSSHIESTIKQINRRVKGSEKFWSEGGAEALLQLAADYLSETDPLTTFWRERPRHATGQRHYQAAA